MEKEIKVSVIITVYNVERYLEECIKSVLNQTLDNIEIIAVNDGSTDRSLGILEKYKKEHNNITIINQVNKGVSAARNTGLKHARGKYIYFLDSDDCIDSKLTEICYNTCQNNRTQISMFDAGVFYENDIKKDNFSFNYERKNELDSNVVKSGEELFCELDVKKCYRVPVWLFFYEKMFLLSNNLYFYDGIIHEDELFTPKVLLKADRVIYIPKDLIFRRVRNNSIMTTKVDIKNVEGYYTVAEELYGFAESIKTKVEKLTYKILISKIISLYSASYKNCIVLSKNNKEYDSLKSKIRKSVLKKRNLNSFKLKVLIIIPNILYIISTIKKNLRLVWMKAERENG